MTSLALRVRGATVVLLSSRARPMTQAASDAAPAPAAVEVDLAPSPLRTEAVRPWWRLQTPPPLDPLRLAADRGRLMLWLRLCAGVVEAAVEPAIRPWRKRARAIETS